MASAFPIDLAKYSADARVQPADMLEIVSGLNLLNTQLDRDNVIQRVADGPITAGDLVASEVSFDRVSRATGVVGPNGVAGNSATDGQPVKVLVYGTREMTLDVGGHVPAMGHVLHCHRGIGPPREAASGTIWTYGIAEDLPQNSLLIGQVVSAGAKQGTVWTGLCDIRMGPGAVVVGQIDTGSVLWTGNEQGVRWEGVPANSDLTTQPEIRWILPAAINVADITHLGGELWVRVGSNTSRGWGPETSQLGQTTLELNTYAHTDSRRWRNEDGDVWFTNVYRGVATGRPSTGAVNRISAFFGSGSNLHTAIGDIRCTIVRDTDLNALRWRIVRITGAATTRRLVIGFNHFRCHVEGSMSDSEVSYVNSV